MRNRFIGALVLILICMTAMAADAKSPREWRADTLRDMRGVYFEVENLAADVEANGLTADIIRRDIEMQLRQAAVRLITEDEWARAPGRPFLYIRVSTVKVGPRYVFHLKVELFQEVRLERYKQIPPVQVPTWGAHEEIGVIDAARIQDLRGYIAEQVDEFIKEYRKMNMV